MDIRTAWTRAPESLMILAIAGSGETATLDRVNQRFLHSSPGAWRCLGWRVHDPAAGRLCVGGSRRKDGRSEARNNPASLRMWFAAERSAQTKAPVEI